MKYGATLGIRFDTKEEENEFAERSLANSLKPEELDSLKKNGVPIGLWARYRNRYAWDVTFAKDTILLEKESPVTYLNGEFDFVGLPINTDIPDSSMPLPRELSYVTMINGKRRNDIIRFNELELMTTFEKLGANNTLVHLEFAPGSTRETTHIRAYNNKESVDLKNTSISAK